MTTIEPTTEPTGHVTAEPAHRRPPRRRNHLGRICRIGRIAALAVAAGAVAALFLALGRAGGATGPVITGTVLLVLIDSLSG